jgi:uroporphyrin-III C-methyltransferase
VRLKGGDPFIFGRGGEEIEHLREAGIEVDVVNGITSGLAAVTSLGVPLTHREHAHGVVFVTGHAHPGSEGADWRSLAAAARDAKLTLVIYMGVSGIARIQSDLLTGLPGSTPVAVVQNATRPDQREAITTLGELDHALAREGLGSPAVIVVGDVIKGVSAVAEAPQRAIAGR